MTLGPDPTRAKRGRSDHADLTFPLRDDFAAALEGPVDDSTEPYTVGADEDLAASAYGGDFFLQEAYLDELARRHTGGRGVVEGTRGSGFGVRGGAFADRTEERVELEVRASFLRPRFLSSDTATTSSSNNNNSKEDTNKEQTVAELAKSLWVAGRAGEEGTVVPVVSPHAGLAQLASQGSRALAELRRRQAREQQNRAVMDTSRSNLAQLLRKDTLGRELVGPSQDLAPERTLKPEQRSLSFHPHQTAFEGAEVDVEEVAALERKLRLERAALAAALGQPSAGEPQTESSTGQRTGKELKAMRKTARHAAVEAAQVALDVNATSETARARRAALQEQQAGLPIHRCRAALLRHIGENVVTIVAGETGSGKTTQLVQFLDEAGYTTGSDGQRIGCTQPRRLAAVAVARRVSDEMGVALGGVVGYAIHLDDCTSPTTRIKFMTDGLLLREVVRDPALLQYRVIIVDEAHERSLDTDVLLGILRRAIRVRADLKLIIASATLDVAKFSEFFGHAPIYEIPGRMHPVEIRYAPQSVPDYVAEAVFRVCQLHLQTPMTGKHDILVFMTGREDVYGTCELIRRRLHELDPAKLETLVILPCLSEASTIQAAVGETKVKLRAPSNDPTKEEAEEEKGVVVTVRLLEAAPPGLRKCVVATNVAETSLTIDGVRYVVDAGFMKTNVFRPRLGMNTLQRYPVSQAQAQQRSGRAGRTAEGICFRLYTEAQFAREMLPDSVPEIQRTSLDSVVLLLKGLGVAGRLGDFDFVDPPPAANLESSMWRLWVLGLLDDAGDITALGHRALEFPLAPALARLLLDSTELGCAVEVARVVALITADPKNFFELPKGREAVAQQHFRRFFHPESDHLTLLNAFTQFLARGRARQWAQDHFLHVPTLLRASEVLEQLVERLCQLHLPVQSCEDTQKGSLEVVRYCLAGAFALQAAQRSGSNWNEYRALLNPGVLCALHPSSAVCTAPVTPPFVIYNDLVFVGKEYLVLVTAVEPEWLAEGGLYQLRKGGKPSTRPDDSRSFVRKPTPLPSSAASATQVKTRAEPTNPQAPPSRTAPAPARTPRPIPPPLTAATAKGTAQSSKFASLGGRRRGNV